MSMVKKRYNTISLFSGAMGLDLGVEKAGFDVKLCVEYDKYACQTIRLNTNVPVIENDINLVSTAEILKESKLKKSEIDVVIGGPPCQAFSTAGKRKSLDDFRGNVIINFLRIVEDIQPRFFILENVRGLLSAELKFLPNNKMSEYGKLINHKGSVLYFLYKEFGKLGYNISFTLFNSANYGVPQKRERLIMLGHLGERIPLPSPTHSESGFETGKKWKTVGEALNGLNENKMEHSKFSDRTKKYLKLIGPGGYWKNLPPDLQKDAMGYSYELGGGKTGFYRRLSFDFPSPTLVTSPTMSATLLCHPTLLRPLSIQEYKRIQEFPDEWILSGNLTQKYKQIGNAVPVGLGYMAAKAIIDFDNGKTLKDQERNNNILYSRYKGCSDFEFIPNFERTLKL